jgi:putative phosphoribosyl transferase
MEKLVHIPADQVRMEGILTIPENSRAIVLFSHGSGSSRFSSRNTFVAKTLQKAGFSTLLIDLLSQEEDSVYETRFDISLLKERLIQAVRWLQKQPESKDLSIGLFGASTGAAAALEAAAVLGDTIGAVVSRGGRPDLAKKILPSVFSPSLFIVGGMDFQVIELNEFAFKELRCVRRFEIVPKATHLFEEPGCLEEVSKLATDWFCKYLFKTS